MAGFSQDLPVSPPAMFQRLNTTSTNSSTSSTSEMDIMRNRVLQMQALAITEREVNFNLLSSLNKYHLSRHPIIGVVKLKTIIV